MHVGDQHALWLQKCNDNFKRARRIPHSIIRPVFPSSQPRHRGCARPFLPNSHHIIQPSKYTKQKQNHNKPGQSLIPQLQPQGPPLLPHLLHLSSSFSLFSFAPATLPRGDSPSPHSNPIQLLSPCLASNPVPIPAISKRAIIQKPSPPHHWLLSRPPLHRLCFVSRFVWSKQSIGNLPYP